jgi:hypothetical protein
MHRRHFLGLGVGLVGTAGGAAASGLTPSTTISDPGRRETGRDSLADGGLD